MSKTATIEIDGKIEFPTIEGKRRSYRYYKKLRESTGIIHSIQV
jgi:predicted RNA-binding protein